MQKWKDCQVGGVREEADEVDRCELFRIEGADGGWLGVGAVGKGAAAVRRERLVIVDIGGGTARDMLIFVVTVLLMTVVVGGGSEIG